MSFWSKIIETIGNESKPKKEVSRDASHYAFVDIEVGVNDKRIHDIGALRWDGATFHSAHKQEAIDFLKDVDFVCGHNIVHHDAKYLLGEETGRWMLVDTLYMSPLLFPAHPYHRLLKDDKLMSEQMNNPVNDCEKAKDLLMDEIAKWEQLAPKLKLIFATLLQDKPEHVGFLSMVRASMCQPNELSTLIRDVYESRICQYSALGE